MGMGMGMEDEDGGWSVEDGDEMGMGWVADEDEDGGGEWFVEDGAGPSLPTPRSRWALLLPKCVVSAQAASSR